MCGSAVDRPEYRARRESYRIAGLASCHVEKLRTATGWPLLLSGCQPEPGPPYSRRVQARRPRIASAAASPSATPRRRPPTAAPTTPRPPRHHPPAAARHRQRSGSVGSGSGPAGVARPTNTEQSATAPATEAGPPGRRERPMQRNTTASANTAAVLSTTGSRCGSRIYLIAPPGLAYPAPAASFGSVRPGTSPPPVRHGVSGDRPAPRDRRVPGHTRPPGQGSNTPRCGASPAPLGWLSRRGRAVLGPARPRFALHVATVTWRTPAGTADATHPPGATTAQPAGGTASPGTR